MLKKLFQGLLVGLISAGLSLSLWHVGLLDGWENTTWAWRVRALAKPSPSTEKIKLILIDQASLDWGATENGLSWPWPREVYGPVLDFCKRSGAKVVAFDMLYSEPSGMGVTDDQAFGSAIQRSSNVVTAFFMGQQAAQISEWPAHVPKPPFQIEGLKTWLNESRKAFLTEPRATFPISDVATNALMLAGVKDVPDRDGVFRRVTPFRLFGDLAIPSLGLAAYLAPHPQSSKAIIHEDELVFSGNFLPIDKNSRVIPRFRGKSGTHQIFNAAQIIQSELRLLEGAPSPIDVDAFRDCYVFFGVSAPGLKDLKSTPVSGDYPGVEIHATFLDNLLEQDFLQDAPIEMVIIAYLILACLCSLVVISSRHAWQSILAFFVFLPLPFAAGFGLYQTGYWWPIVAGECAIGLSLISAVVLNYATEGRQKRFIKSAFKHYLSGDVIEQILVNPDQLKLGGEKRELSLFFSDLEKFSSFSEKLDPPALTALLNDYLTDMTTIIMEEGGTLDKYVGDAIVAFWNAPVSQADHTVRVCRAALLCQRKLTERREEFRHRTNAVLKMRIGINTGEVVVGNLGSHERFNYTVLGDAANLASRLEGANKAFGTYLLVAESTWSQAKASLIGREIGLLQVVGRQKPVRVFEVLGLAGEQAPSYLSDYEKALGLCRDKRWAEAYEAFERVGDDPASKTYAEKCRQLRDGTIKEWDGVWSLTEK